MKVFNVGIIGVGAIGKVHAYGYLNLPLFYAPPPIRARVTHVCTSRPESAEEAANLVGAEHACTDFTGITENPDVDIVHVCTPNHLHKDALLSAMRHNKHIYCDKPLVADMDEAEEIRSALGAYRGVSQMTFQNRFFPATMRAKQLVDEGFLGDVLDFRAVYLHSGSADPNAPAKWKLTAQAGGGVMADLASHVMDLIHHLVGNYRSIMAETHIAYAERPSPTDASARVTVDAEDTVKMLVRMDAGALGSIEATKIATGAEDELRLEIHGSDGALRFNLMEAHYLEIYDSRSEAGEMGGQRGWTRIATGQRYPTPGAGFPSPKAGIGWLRSHVACLANFLDGVARGKPVQPDLAHGVLIQHLMECAKRSDREKRWVDV